MRRRSLESPLEDGGVPAPHREELVAVLCPLDPADLAAVPGVGVGEALGLGGGAGEEPDPALELQLLRKLSTLRRLRLLVHLELNHDNDLRFKSSTSWSR